MLLHFFVVVRFSVSKLRQLGIVKVRPFRQVAGNAPDAIYMGRSANGAVALEAGPVTAIPAEINREVN